LLMTYVRLWAPEGVNPGSRTASRDSPPLRDVLIADAVEQAKDEIHAPIESWDFESALAEVSLILTDAIEFAASRDFEAHQSAKEAERLSEE
jgi:hypothetical protein